MANNIGKMSVLIAADTSPLSDGLSAAADAVRKFGDSVAGETQRSLGAATDVTKSRLDSMVTATARLADEVKRLAESIKFDGVAESAGRAEKAIVSMQAVAEKKTRVARPGDDDFIGPMFVPERLRRKDIPLDNSFWDNLPPKGMDSRPMFDPAEAKRQADAAAAAEKARGEAAMPAFMTMERLAEEQRKATRVWAELAKPTQLGPAGRPTQLMPLEAKAADELLRPTTQLMPRSGKATQFNLPSDRPDFGPAPTATYWERIESEKRRLDEESARRAKEEFAAHLAEQKRLADAAKAAAAAAVPAFNFGPQYTPDEMQLRAEVAARGGMLIASFVEKISDAEAKARGIPAAIPMDKIAEPFGPKLLAAASAAFGGIAKGADWTANLAVKSFAGLLNFFGETLPAAIGKGFGKIMPAIDEMVGLWKRAMKEPAALLSDLSGKLADFLGDKIPYVGGLLAMPFQGLQAAFSGVSSLLGIFEKESSAIRDLGRAAKRSGLDLADMNYLVHAATLSGIKDPVEALERGLFRFQDKLAEAATGGKAGTAFKRMGLDPIEMAGMGSAQGFRQFAQGFASLGSAALQASVATDIFGRQGKELVPMLLKGAEGLDQAREMVDRFGLALGEADLRNAATVNRARKQLDMFQAGFNAQVFGGLAPILAEAVDRVGDLKLSFNGLADLIVDGFGKAGQVIAFVGDNLRDWDTTLFAPIKAGWNMLVAAILDGLAEIGDSLPTLKQIAWEVVKGVGEASAMTGPFAGVKAAWEWWNKKPAGEADEEDDSLFGFKEAAKARRERAAELLEGLNDLAAKQLADGSGKMQNAFADFMKGVRDRTAEIGRDTGDAFVTAFEDRLSKLKESLKGPLDAFETRAKEINRLVRDSARLPQTPQETDMWNLAFPNAKRALRGGGMFPQLAEDNPLLAGLREASDLAMGKAFAELQTAFGKDLANGYKPVGALQQGTREAYSAITAYQQGSAREDVQQKMKALLEVARQQREQQIKVGREAAEALKQIQGDLKVGGF